MDTNSAPVKTKLPQYRSHKCVQAAKITSITKLAQIGTDPTGSVLAFDEAESIIVPDTFIAKHAPQVGGYFIIYPDGYMSFSPAGVFEDGYTSIGAGCAGVVSLADARERAKLYVLAGVSSAQNAHDVALYAGAYKALTEAECISASDANK